MEKSSEPRRPVAKTYRNAETTAVLVLLKNVLHKKLKDTRQNPQTMKNTIVKA